MGGASNQLDTQKVIAQVEYYEVQFQISAVKTTYLKL